MEDVQNINKTIYKLTLFTIKLMPIIISFIYFINAVLSLFGYDIPCLSIIAGTSIITVLFLYLVSTAFRFCFYHRIFIHYILINNIITINDVLISYLTTNKQNSQNIIDSVDKHKKLIEMYDLGLAELTPESKSEKEILNLKSEMSEIKDLLKTLAKEKTQKD